MRISGLQKLAMVDFPGKLAATVFTGGCNLRCPFCHNAPLVNRVAETPELSEEDVLAFLKSRKGLLDGVVLSGGEPLLQHDAADFLKKVRELGFAVKLDTNGCFPQVLADILQQELVDYVAMDIKNSREKYCLTAGVPGLSMDKIEESMAFLLSDAVDYEFRTTVVRELHDEKDFQNMARWIPSLSSGKKAKRLFLQSFVDRTSVLCPGYSAPEEGEMENFLTKIQIAAESAKIRGNE